ncbi:MAG: hypothetical protein WCR52_17530 [Bacteroidota bacterium]
MANFNSHNFASHTEVILHPEVVVDAPELEARAIRSLEMSEKACLIYNSVRSEVKMIPTVLVTSAV